MLTPEKIERRKAAKTRDLNRRAMRRRKHDTSYLPQLLESGVLG